MSKDSMRGLRASKDLEGRAGVNLQATRMGSRRDGGNIIINISLQMLERGSSTRC